MSRSILKVVVLCFVDSSRKEAVLFSSGRHTGPYSGLNH